MCKESLIPLTGQLEINWNFACDTLTQCFTYGNSIAKLVPCKHFMALQKRTEQQNWNSCCKKMYKEKHEQLDYVASCEENNLKYHSVIGSSSLADSCVVWSPTHPRKVSALYWQKKLEIAEIIIKEADEKSRKLEGNYLGCY